MRVLHVYSGNMFGGVENFLVTLARCRDFVPELEHHFALCFEGRLSRELEACDAPVHRLGAVRARYPLSVWRGRGRLAACLRKTSFDVVIMHCEWPMAIFGPVARRSGVPVVFWNHSFVENRHWYQRWAKQSVPDLAISTSRTTEATVAQLYPGVRSTWIHCPMILAPFLTTETSARRQLRLDLKTPEDATVIVQASRLEPLKGHRRLLDALGQLAHLPGWVCWIAGGAQRPDQRSYLEELRQTTKTLKIADRVHFLGERADIATLLNAADLYCQPNEQPDGFGLCFVEALAARLPVVTTSIGGALEVVNEDCGILTPPGESVQLASALRTLIEHRDLRCRLGANGPARARQLCDAGQQFRKIADVLDSLVPTCSVDSWPPHWWPTQRPSHRNQRVRLGTTDHTDFTDDTDQTKVKNTSLLPLHP